MDTHRESSITREQLIENGWIFDVEGGPFLAEKDLVDRSELEDDEDGVELSMVVHSFDNTPMFALCVDGYLININPASIEELNAFERQIISVEPPF